MAEALRSMRIYERTADGLILKATDTGTPETTAGIFAVGAEITNTATGQTFVNVGTTASPSWQETNGLAMGGAIASGTAGSLLFVGTGGVLAQDNANLFWDDTNNRLGFGTTAPTHSSTHASTSTGIALYNTADQTTNYERLLVDVSSNVFRIRSEKGGTGTARALSLISDSASSNITATLNVGATGATTGLFKISRGTSGTGLNVVSVDTGSGSMSQSSGTIGMLAIQPTIAQTSTAGYTALLINPTESTTGSGTKRLIDAQVGGTTQFNVSNTGVVNVAAATATPAGGSTSARLLFGTTAGFGVYYGSGVPTVSAGQGSIYLRSDGSSTSTRLYVNTDGATTWTNVTTAA